MTQTREILEGPQEQGAEEIVTYTLTVPTTWGTPTGTPTVKAYSYIDQAYTDVTSTVIPTNAPTVASQVITLSPLKLLTVGVLYRVEVLFATSEGNTFEAFGWVQCNR